MGASRNRKAGMSIRKPQPPSGSRLARFAPGAAGLLLAVAGCSGSADEAPDVVVSILPQAWLVEQIGGPEVRVEVLVGPGQSPATFDPGPRQIADLLEADLFIRAGVPFERGLLPKIERMPNAPRILAPDLDRTAPDPGDGSPEAAHAGHAHEQGHGHDHGGLDPHTWLDPNRFRAEAQVVCDELCRLRPESAETFRRRTAELDGRLVSLDAEIRAALAPYRGASFFVFHPAYGHFARAYGLHQIAIELDGHEPGARHLAGVIDRARASGARAVIVQPQFAGETARRVADEIGGEVIALDPLARDYERNLRRLAGALAELLAARTTTGSSP